MAEETIPKIRSDIERSREDMARTAEQIEHRVEELKNWRTAVKQYPLASLGVSVVVGLLASGALPGILRSAVTDAGPVIRSGLVALLMDAIQGD